MTAKLLFAFIQSTLPKGHGHPLKVGFHVPSPSPSVYHCSNGDGLFGFRTHSVHQCKFDGDGDGDGDGDD